MRVVRATQSLNNLIATQYKLSISSLNYPINEITRTNRRFFDEGHTSLNLLALIKALWLGIITYIEIAAFQPNHTSLDLLISIAYTANEVRTAEDGSWQLLISRSSLTSPVPSPCAMPCHTMPGQVGWL